MRDLIKQNELKKNLTVPLWKVTGQLTEIHNRSGKCIKIS